MPATAATTTTRDSILERAVQLASTDGLEGLTIGRLADAIGMSKSGLFRHFGSKEELQLATIARARELFVTEVVVPIAGLEPGGERLRALCESYLGYVESPPFAGGCFWSATGAEFDDRPGPVRDAIRDALGAWLEALARDAGAAGAADPEQLAFEIHALGQGANLAFRMFGDRAAFERARGAIEERLSGLPGAR